MVHHGPTLFSVTGLFGVRVDLGRSLFVLAGVLVLLAGLSNLVWVAILVAMLFVSIYLHELGHAWGCRIQGVAVKRIVLHGGGGFCEHARPASRAGQELIIALGPLVNLALWALASLAAEGIFASGATGLYATGSYLMLFARLNLALCLFNLVPVQPLDGGKLLQLAFLRVLPQGLAMRAAGAVGLVFALLWWPALVYVYLTFGWFLLFAPPILLHWHMARGRLRP